MKTGIDGVVFGHMHEDHSLELSLLGSLPAKRAVVIASGGDLAFALAARQMDVIAVDLNPAQIELVKLKIHDPSRSAEMCFSGRVDQVLRMGGPIVAWLLDWPDLRPGRLRRFMINGLEGLLRLAVSMVHGSRAGSQLDSSAIRLMLRRLNESMRRPDAGTNPLLQVLLGNRFGSEVPEVWSAEGIMKWKPETGRITLIVSDVSSALKQFPENSLGLISVSNLPDALDERSWNELVELAARSLAPGGYLIARSMLLETIASANGNGFIQATHIATDSSPLCPVVWIGKKS